MKVNEIIENAEKRAESLFRELDRRALFNQKKVLDAFREAGVSYHHFNPTTGYGYGDAGREKLGEVFAGVFGAEAAIVSPNIVSGTHALTVALFGLLKTGDSFISATGEPYDTLKEVISGKGNGSLAEYGIGYESIPLKGDSVDLETLGKKLKEKRFKLVMLTRSRGYDWRRALALNEIASACALIKKISPETVVMVDNCYGEFVCTEEPTEFGADVVVGSLIKNIGGGIAPTGGYVAGKRDLVEKIGYRLTSPSIGTEVGSYAYGYMPFFEGLFFAPSVVRNALKGVVLASYVFDGLGFEALPVAGEIPYDIVCSVKFLKPEPMIKFIQSVQYVSPVDSSATPEPWDMPGYDDRVIMAAGTFVAGASIELSADGPVKPPYIAYFQGGLTYEHVKLALAEALKDIV